jgi:hypothetical protein
MHRFNQSFVFLLLSSSCVSSQLAPLEGFSNNGLRISTLAELRTCDGLPCTSITIELRQISGYAAADSVLVTADGGPPIATVFTPYTAIKNGGKYSVDLPGWIDSIRVEATTFDAQSAIWSNRVNFTPTEMNVQFPNEMTVGSKPSLTWDGQGRPVKTHIVFATSAPDVWVGSLEAFGTDDGIFEFGPSVFSNVGTYTIGLSRHLEHFTESFDDNLQLTWISSWQKVVDVLPAAPTE